MPLFKSQKPPATAPSMNVAGPDADEPTFPCKICGRKFVKSSLVKHEPACKIMSNPKRKPFESGVQRVKGSDLSMADVLRVKKEIERNKGVFQRPKTNWKERHEEFIMSVKAGKGVEHALKTGAPLPPPPPSKTPSDYVQCEYCGRNFNANAAERHIPFCRDQASKNGMLSNAKQQVQRSNSMSRAVGQLCLCARAQLQGPPKSRSGSSGAPATRAGQSPATRGGPPATRGGAPATRAGQSPATRNGTSNAPRQRSNSASRATTGYAEPDRQKTGGRNAPTRSGGGGADRSSVRTRQTETRGATRGGDKPPASRKGGTSPATRNGQRR